MTKHETQGKELWHTTTCNLSLYTSLFNMGLCMVLLLLHAIILCLVVYIPTGSVNPTSFSILMKVIFHLYTYREGAKRLLLK